jgi:hypothetical protein
LLKARSRWGGDTEEVPVPQNRPEAGHDAARLTLGAGVRDGDAVHVVRFRPAHHALTDDGTGYVRGAQVEFMAADVRYYPKRGDWELERLDVVDVMSLSPRDRLFKPLSWRGLVGVHQRDFFEDEDRVVLHARVGAGYTCGLGARGFGYALGEGRIEVAGDYADGYVAAPGLEAGVSCDITKRWKAVARAECAYFASGAEDFEAIEIRCDQNISLSRNQAMSLEAGWSVSDGFDQVEGMLLWNVFF